MMLVSSSKMLLPPEDRSLVPCPRDVSSHCRGLKSCTKTVSPEYDGRINSSLKME